MPMHQVVTAPSLPGMPPSARFLEGKLTVGAGCAVEVRGEREWGMVMNRLTCGSFLVLLTSRELVLIGS